MVSHDKIIYKLVNLISWCDCQIDGLKIPNEPRYRIAAGCFYAAMEYQKAIVLLVSKQVYGPALSLVRPLYEAFLRGAWLWKCASEKQMENFIKGGAPGLSLLLKDVEKLEGYELGILSTIKNSYGKNMNAYVHTGFDQVVRLQTQKYIEKNYDSAEIKDVLELAKFFGCMSAMKLCEMSGDLHKMNYIFMRLKE